jgi:hypothetical protein
MSSGWRETTNPRGPDNFTYEKGEPTLVLIDHDRKTTPPKVGNELEFLGGVTDALTLIMPALETTGRVLRA